MNKRDDLHMLTANDDYHFVFITESWLHDYIPNSLVFDCNKYNVYRRDRVSSRGGGVCILINKRYKVMTMNISEKDSDLEILAVDVVFKQLNYRLILCYRPPGYSTTIRVILTGSYNVYVIYVTLNPPLCWSVILIYRVSHGQTHHSL